MTPTASKHLHNAMGKRNNLRIKMVLPLRTWGTDSAGKPFVQLAHTLDVCQTGLRLGGFRCLLTPGDSVGVQYRMNKAQFRVAWVGRPGSATADQIGLENLDKDKKILGLDLPQDNYRDDYEPPDEEKPLSRSQHHRAHVRHPVIGTVEVTAGYAVKGTQERLSDLSKGGCYVQCSSPLTVHTKVKLLLKVAACAVSVRGVVRTCHPNIGMGIQFTEFENDAHKERLYVLLVRVGREEKTIADATASDADAALASLAAMTLAPAKPKPDSAHLTHRLQSASNELLEIEELIKSIGPDPAVLRQFRETVSLVRNTTWAVERWNELNQQREDVFPVVTYLNNERVRLAGQLCRSLCKDLQTMELKLEKRELDELLKSVEELFSHLAGFSLVEEHPEVATASVFADSMVAAPAIEPALQSNGYGAATTQPATSVMHATMLSEVGATAATNGAPPHTELASSNSTPPTDDELVAVAAVPAAPAPAAQKKRSKKSSKRRSRR